MTTVTIDTLDAIELAEILDYFLDRLDILAEHNLAKLLFAECSPYDLDDLRADVTRLVNHLHTARLTP